jgi:hypothetical protein
MNSRGFAKTNGGNSTSRYGYQVVMRRKYNSVNAELFLILFNNALANASSVLAAAFGKKNLWK